MKLLGKHLTEQGGEDAHTKNALIERQGRALEMVVRGEPLGTVLEEICHIIEWAATDRVAAAISRVEGGRLLHGAAPTLSAAYNSLVDGISIEPNVGTCPAAAAKGEVVITENIAEAPNWSAFSALPLAEGWRAVWSMPIFDQGGQVIATIGTYFTTCRGPTTQEVRLVSILARTAGLAIERTRADERLYRQGARAAFIAELEDALRGLSDPSAIIEAAASKLAHFLSAERCTYATQEGAGVLVVRGSYSETLPSLEGAWPLSGFGVQFESAMQAGKTYVIHDTEADLDIDPVIREAFAQTQVRAAISVPLLKEGKLSAIMSVDQTYPRNWREDEFEVTEQVVGRCWEAVERARIATGLRESEERYRAIVQATPECVKLVAPDGTLLQMNEAGLKMVGATCPADAIGRSIFDVIAPEFREDYREMHKRVCSGRQCELEYQIIAPDGTRRWMATTAVPMAWSGNGWGQLSITRDVTQRVQVDRALADSRARLDYAVRLSGIGFWYCDLPFDELVWDARVKAHFFLPPDARVTIETFYEQIHPDDRIPTQASIERSISERLPYDVQYRTVEKSTGKIKWIRALGGTTYGADGSPIRFDGITVDVTASRENEDHLAALLERERMQGRLLNEVAQAARTIYSATSVESVLKVITEESRRIISAHQAVASLTLGQDWSQAVVSVSLSEKYADYRDFKGAPSGTGIYALVCETNTPMRLTQDQLESHPRWRAFSTDGGRHPPLRGWLAVPLVAHDGANIGLVQLSDRYEGEFDEVDHAILIQLAQIGAVALETTRLYERLRDQDRRKDEFLATLAHELRNPLAPIRTGITLLSIDPSAGVRERVMPMMDRQLSALVRMVDDLLDVSRITHGKIALTLEVTDIRTAIQAAVESVQPLLTERDHCLELELPLTPLSVEADPTRLAQIIANLLNNAARYTSPGGRITVRAGLDSAEAVLEVEDNGTGIPASQLERIFELFAQVDAPGTKLHGGLGLGLTLVRRLVELHGGTISAHSDGVGLGSRFVVRLPALRSVNAGGGGCAVDVRSDNGTGGLRVLVVDDNVDAAESMGMLLRAHGHQVDLSFDGQGALEKAKSFQPDVVLLDIGLPGLNGYDVAARLRQQSDRMPILVAVTGWGTEADRQRAQEAGFLEHLVKPVDASRLATIFKKVAKGSESPRVL